MLEPREHLGILDPCGLLQCILPLLLLADSNLIKKLQELLVPIRKKRIVHRLTLFIQSLTHDRLLHDEENTLCISPRESSTHRPKSTNSEPDSPDPHDAPNAPTPAITPALKV